MQYFGLIYKTAMLFKEQHPGILQDVEDLVQEAFVKMPEIKGAYKRYPKKSECKFSTFLVYRLEFYFMDLTRHDRRDVVRSMPHEFVPDKPVEPYPFPPSFIGKLSEDTQRFIDCVMDFPEEFREYISRANKMTPFPLLVCNFLKINYQKLKDIEKELEDKFIR